MSAVGCEFSCKMHQRGRPSVPSLICTSHPKPALGYLQMLTRLWVLPFESRNCTLIFAIHPRDFFCKQVLFLYHRSRKCWLLKGEEGLGMQTWFWVPAAGLGVPPKERVGWMESAGGTRSQFALPCRKEPTSLYHVEWLLVGWGGFSPFCP